ncbi:MAG: hypothetical protein L6420_07420 [Elusimicrobia bacterium]|nr:hypothetical protein [Elusimicrobiota bacterium]
MSRKNKKNVLGISALFIFPLVTAFLLSGCIDMFNTKKKEPAVFPETPLETMKETQVPPAEPVIIEEPSEELSMDEIDEEKSGTVVMTSEEEIEPATEEIATEEEIEPAAEEQIEEDVIQENEEISDSSEEPDETEEPLE